MPALPFLWWKNICLIRKNIPLLEPCLVNIDELSSGVWLPEENKPTIFQEWLLFGEVCGKECFVWKRNSVRRYSLYRFFALLFWWGWREIWASFIIIMDIVFDKDLFAKYFWMGWLSNVDEKCPGFHSRHSWMSGVSLICLFHLRLAYFTKGKNTLGSLVYLLN